MEISFDSTPCGPLSNTQIKRQMFTEIQKAQFDKKFPHQKYIGKGMQGQVFQAQYEGQKVAIKNFVQTSLSAHLISYVKSEIQSLDLIHHPNVLSFIGTYQVIYNSHKKVFCVVTQFCQSSLQDHWIICPLSDLQKLLICSEMVAGIKACHQNEIIHRDIKPENILIKDLESMQVKIADFGCSRKKHDTTSQKRMENLAMTQGIGTPHYCDPNVEEGNYTQKCDIYSIGLVIVYVFCGSHFFSHCTQRNQLKKEKKKFTDDTINSTQQFLETFGEEEVSSKMKEFLTEIALFTMSQDQQNRYSAQDLLDYINDQIKNLEKEEIYKTKVLEPYSTISQVKNEIQDEKLFKKNKAFKQIEDEEGQFQQQELSIKKQSTQEPLDLSQRNEQKSILQSQYSSVSKSTIKTADQSQSNLMAKRESSNKKLEKEDDHSESSGSNKVIQSNDQGYNTPKRDLTRQMEFQNKLKQSQNSFISSDSNEFGSNWGKNSHKMKSQSRVLNNLKSSSMILDSRIPKIRTQSSADESYLRQSRINQRQKILDDRQKLCSELIKHLVETANLNEEGEMMKQLLTMFRTLKLNFELIKRIGEITQSSFTKEQKQIIVFLFHFMYAGKMKDIWSFVYGQPSNLKLEYIRIGSKKKEVVNQIAEAQLKRIFDNMKIYATDLQRKVFLIRPKISDFTIKCINEVLMCSNSEDLMKKISYKEIQIKNETRKFIEEKLNTMKNQDDSNVLKELNRALSKICL